MLRREEGHIRTRGQGFQRFFYRFENRKIRATHCAEEEGGTRGQGFSKENIKRIESFLRLNVTREEECHIKTRGQGFQRKNDQKLDEYLIETLFLLPY